jgi:pantothenate kinase
LFLALQEIRDLKIFDLKRVKIKINSYIKMVNQGESSHSPFVIGVAGGTASGKVVIFF